MLRAVQPPAPALKEPLVVRLLRCEERSCWRQVINQHHCLGLERLVGQSLCYVATAGQDWVAALKCPARSRALRESCHPPTGAIAMSLACSYCSQPFVGSPFRPAQIVCSQAECRQYHRHKIRTDPVYHKICLNSQKQWRASLPD